MKLRPFLLLLLATLLALASPRPSRAADVSFSFFYDSLAPHGEWLEVGDYGYCWKPTGVDEDWAPYADGYWSYTDGGWTWVSYEDFGGVVYHYGRWAKVEDEGWCWVPGYEWGPAWVSWRNNDDYIGWAPLPPEARWRQDRGISVWTDTSYDIGPSYYNFCRSYDFGAPVMRACILPRRENVVIIGNTVNITNITYNTGAGCVFNGGLDYGYVNRFARRQVPALKLVQNTNVTVINNNVIINNNVRVKNVNAVQQGNQLVVVAPTVIRPQNEQITAMVKPGVRRVVPQDRVNKGWGSVPEAQRTALRAKFKQQAKDLTPETAPAKPLKVADLQVLPEKADPTAPSPVITRKDRPRPGVRGDGRPTTEDATPADIAGQPVDPRDAAKIAREKAAKKKPGEAPAPIPTPDTEKVATEQPSTAENPPVTNVPSANPRDAAKIAREKAAKKKPGEAPAPIPTPDPGKVATEQPSTAVNPPVTNVPPANPRDAAKIAREKALKKKPVEANVPAEAATPQPAQPPIVREPARPRPGVIQPFNPATADAPPAITQVPDNDAAEKRNAAQERQRASEAAKQQAAEQQTIRQRQVEQQQQQNAARQRVQEQQQQKQAQDAARERAAEATQQRQQIQQQQQEQAGARQRAAEQQQAIRQRQTEQVQQQEAVRERANAAAVQRQRVQEQQQQQQAGRERAAQVNEARQRAIQQQQAQAAAREQAAERSQAPNNARQQAVQQQQAQMAARQQALERAQAQAATRQQVAPQQRQVPPQRTAPGKRKLTPEEAAALQGQ